MAKGRNTSTVSFRIPDKQYFAIQTKAAKKNLSIGDYSKQLVLKEALREHKGKAKPSLRRTIKSPHKAGTIPIKDVRKAVRQVKKER